MEHLPETAHGTLSLLFNTKSQNDALANKFIEDIEEGRISGIKAHIYIKSIENLIERFTDAKKHPESVERYKKLLEDEVAKHPKTFTMYDATFNVKGGRATYDYSVCNDPILTELENAFLIAKKRLETHQEFLKHIPSSGQELRRDDELITVYPPNKIQPDIIAVTLPK